MHEQDNYTVHFLVRLTYQLINHRRISVSFQYIISNRFCT